MKVSPIKNYFCEHVGFNWNNDLLRIHLSENYNLRCVQEENKIPPAWELLCERVDLQDLITLVPTIEPATHIIDKIIERRVSKHLIVEGTLNHLINNEEKTDEERGGPISSNKPSGV